MKCDNSSGTGLSRLGQLTYFLFFCINNSIVFLFLTIILMNYDKLSIKFFGTTIDYVIAIEMTKLSLPCRNKLTKYRLTKQQKTLCLCYTLYHELSNCSNEGYLTLWANQQENTFCFRLAHQIKFTTYTIHGQQHTITNIASY